MFFSGEVSKISIVISIIPNECYSVLKSQQIHTERKQHSTLSFAGSLFCWCFNIKYWFSYLQH